MYAMTVMQALQLLNSGQYEDPQLEAWNRALDAADSPSRRFWLAVWDFYNWETWAPPGAQPRLVDPLGNITPSPQLLHSVALEMMRSKPA